MLWQSPDGHSTFFLKENDAQTDKWVVLTITTWCLYVSVSYVCLSELFSVNVWNWNAKFILHSVSLRCTLGPHQLVKKHGLAIGLRCDNLVLDIICHLGTRELWTKISSSDQKLNLRLGFLLLFSVYNSRVAILHICRNYSLLSKNSRRIIQKK